MCERQGKSWLKHRSKFLQLGSIFRPNSKVRRYLLYPPKQLYNPQQTATATAIAMATTTAGSGNDGNNGNDSSGVEDGGRGGSS